MEVPRTVCCTNSITAIPGYIRCCVISPSEFQADIKEAWLGAHPYAGENEKLRIVD